jgi:PAS domain S-box-containing protein
MKNLKTFSAYLKDEKLLAFTKESIDLLKTMDIPLLKLFKNISEEQLLQMSLVNNELFFSSIVDDTALKNAADSLVRWDEDKIPGISRNDIQPTDLVLIYALQKKVMLNHLPAYADTVAEATHIISELEDYYTIVQSGAVNLLFKIQKETETMLRESEDRYGDLFESTNDLIHIVDTDRKIKYLNNSWLSGLGYTKEEALHMPIRQFIQPASLNAYNLAEQKAIAGRTTEPIEAIFVTKSGEELILEGSISCKFSAESLVYTSGIFKNVTRRKEMETELNNKATELTRSNNELEQFAYVASHDLQEPLRMINSYIQLLASRYKDHLDQDANDFINFAVDGSNRMRTLIQSLLEYSRVNRIKPFEWVNAGDILQDVLTDLENTLLETGVQIHYGQLPVIFADSVLIGQLLQNLISNAIKFRNTSSPEIHISGEKKDNHFLFSVRDNGIGIQKPYFDKIFVIFQRLNGMEKYPGTGIGLAICKKIVERHGGNIWVESEYGKGSVFYFTLK